MGSRHLFSEYDDMGLIMAKSQSALLTDLYQLNMMAAYLEHGLTETAVFELFVRKLPSRRGFLMAAGLEQALQFLETVSFTPEDIKKIRGLGQFSESFLAYLRSFRFTGDVDAMPEGTVFFPDEPILRVTAPLPEAQFVETRLVNLLHFQTVDRLESGADGACCAWEAAGRLRAADARMAPRPGCSRLAPATSPGSAVRQR